ncbi:uncharacterized protein LOC118601720 [Rousettus aegyptiacus]|uniref:uncharacterized protein LOC118601720 n=1 Tax=Rousettus aegyptiacus TaxID=9407 RepID=UPI00168CF0FC|nr:uncharacterized protein LOC118601720 [Rousettus aegyptiacus]
MTPLKRSLDSSSELLEGTSESHMGDVSQDPVMPPVQRRKLDPLPQKHRHLKIAKTKIMRKKKKEKVNPHHSTIFPTSLVPLQSEEGEVVDTKPILLSAQENDPDLLSEDKLQSQQNEGACVMHQEYQAEPCEFSVSQEPRPSSSAVTSLASPLRCISHFLSCVCQTFSRPRKQKPPT